MSAELRVFSVAEVDALADRAIAALDNVKPQDEDGALRAAALLRAFLQVAYPVFDREQINDAMTLSSKALAYVVEHMLELAAEGGEAEEDGAASGNGRVM